MIIAGYNRTYKKEMKSRTFFLFLWPQTDRKADIFAAKREGGAFDMDANKRQRYEKISI